jgi:hypothetical protein
MSVMGQSPTFLLAPPIFAFGGKADIEVKGFYVRLRPTGDMHGSELLRGNLSIELYSAGRDSVI